MVGHVEIPGVGPAPGRLGVGAVGKDVMIGVDHVSGKKPLCWNTRRIEGRREIRTADWARRCPTGPLAGAGEVAARVLACEAGEDEGTEVLGAYDALSSCFVLRGRVASNSR